MTKTRAVVAAGETPAVLLIDPKFPHNVGGVVRACSCWGARQVRWTGHRVDPEAVDGRLPREERMKGYKDVRQVPCDPRPFDAFPRGTIPVAVEIRPGAQSLVDFEHPVNALYVFGPEDGSIPQVVLSLCHRFIFIPTSHCLNLAAAVNVVLADRRMKAIRDGVELRVTLDDYLQNEKRGWVRFISES